MDEGYDKSLKVQPEPQVFPEFHRFPDDLLNHWIAIPNDELMTIGPIPKGAIDQLLFSTQDLARAVHALRAAFIFQNAGDSEQANTCLENCLHAANDADTRNRLLFDAVVRSTLGARNVAG